MANLSVKEMELGTLTSHLKNKNSSVIELEEKEKRREVMLS